jgi:hypothetical protein
MIRHASTNHIIPWHCIQTKMNLHTRARKLLDEQKTEEIHQSHHYHQKNQQIEKAEPLQQKSEKELAAMVNLLLIAKNYKEAKEKLVIAHLLSFLNDIQVEHKKSEKKVALVRKCIPALQDYLKSVQQSYQSKDDILSVTEMEDIEIPQLMGHTKQQVTRVQSYSNAKDFSQPKIP